MPRQPEKTPRKQQVRVEENLSFVISCPGGHLHIKNHVTGTEHLLRNDLVTKMRRVAHLIRQRFLATGGLIDIDEGVNTAIVESEGQFLITSTRARADDPKNWHMRISLKGLDLMASAAHEHTLNPKAA